MKRWQTGLSAVALCGLALQIGWAPVPAAAAQKWQSASPLNQAIASVEGMLRSNAQVSYRQPKSIAAPMRYVASPTAATQLAIDDFNARNEVTTQLVHLSVDAEPIWHNQNAYMIYADLTYNERFAKTKRVIRDVTWRYLYVSQRVRKDEFRVTDVLPITVIAHQSQNPRFDYAPVVDYPEISASFRNGLARYEEHVHYAPAHVSIKLFGYYDNPVTHKLNVYLFAHDGLSVPVYAISGQLQARLHGDTLFHSAFVLSERSFGILFPDQTRFTVLTLPASAIDDMQALRSYSSHTTFAAQFAYRPL